MKNGIVIVVAVVVIFLIFRSFSSPSIKDYIAKEYPLVDVVESSVNRADTSKIYKAEGKSLDEVSQDLVDHKKPDQISEEKEHKQVLVYNDDFVILTQSPDDPDSTQIEAATSGFVRDNYQPSYFNGLFTYLLLSQMLHVNNWGTLQDQRCGSFSGGCYQGYARSGGSYKGPSSVPASFRNATRRGGGPGAGK